MSAMRRLKRVRWPAKSACAGSRNTTSARLPLFCAIVSRGKASAMAAPTPSFWIAARRLLFIVAILPNAQRLTFPCRVLPALERSEERGIGCLALGRHRVEPHHLEASFIFAFAPG